MDIGQWTALQGVDSFVMNRHLATPIGIRALLNDWRHGHVRSIVGDNIPPLAVLKFRRSLPGFAISLESQCIYS